MKKILVLILLLCILMSNATILLCATESSATDAINSSFNYLPHNSVTYSCRYNSEQKIISVSGTVDHDIMVTHRNYWIEVYAIEPDQTLESVLESGDEPIARNEISISFDFSFSATSATERFSQYAIALRSPADELLLVDTPRFVEIPEATEESIPSKQYFKGLQAPTNVHGSGFHVGTAIVPVDLSKLLNETGGYVYLIGDSYRYFDKTYMDSIDAQVRSYSCTGTRVYLQFLTPQQTSSSVFGTDDQAQTQYVMPDVFDGDTMTYLSAISTFLSERYSSYESGEICGIIVGKQIDHQQYNAWRELSLEAYARQYAFYLTLVAQSVRYINPNLELIIPFSDQNTAPNELTPYQQTDLLEAILRNLDASYPDGFSCGTMIESDAYPRLPIPSSTPDSRNTDESAQLETDFTIETVGAYAEYLEKLNETYRCAPSHFLFLWQAPEDLMGNDLSCAYAYSYLKLSQIDRLSSMLFCGQRQQMDTLKKIIRYIDTEQSASVTDPLLSVLGATSWGELLGATPLQTIPFRSFKQVQPIATNAHSFTGTFDFFDFSNGMINGWLSGVGCPSIKSDYNANGERALYASCLPGEQGGASELLYLYEYPENFAHTPYLKIQAEIVDGVAKNNGLDVLYEVVISVGNQEGEILCSYLIKSGEKNELIMDLESFAEEHTATYLKIQTRSLSDPTEAYSLLLYDIVGCSTEYSSDELNDRITNDRLQLRNAAQEDEEDGDTQSLIWIIFGILLAVTAVGAGVLMAMRKDEEQADESNHNSSSNST